MAITLVGSAETNLGSSGSVTITLPVDTAQNDLVIVAVAAAAGNVDRNVTEGSGTYTEVADLYSNDTSDVNLGVYYKLQGATPDTSVTLNTVTGSPIAQAYVLRGVDTTTPMDAAATTATGIDSPDPDPPSITTVTANAWVVVVGASSESVEPTAPTNYTDLTSNTGSSSSLSLARREIASPGAEDPGIFDVTGGTTADSWCAVTMAIRPAAGGGGPVLNANPLALLGVGRKLP